MSNEGENKNVPQTSWGDSSPAVASMSFSTETSIPVLGLVPPAAVREQPVGVIEVDEKESLSASLDKLSTEQTAEDEDDPIMEVKDLRGLIESAHEVQVKLSDQQNNKDSPLYSVNSFEQLGLSEELLKGIYAMKFQKPSKVQEKALPLLLSNPPQNMIAQSQSGTGKTAAFVLTMLSRIDVNESSTQALCLAPTRELARQIMDVVQQMGQFTKVTTAYALKDLSGQGPQNSHLVVGTPGTVLEMVRRRHLDLSTLKILVFDEADVMLDTQGMGDQSFRVRKTCPMKIQILLFSATFSNAVRVFANKLVPNANTMTLKREELSIDAIKQFYMDCTSTAHKFEILGALYGLLTIGQSIIFTHTRETADQIQKFMEKEGHMTCLLHGGLESVDRDRVIDDFRSGKSKVLISTNVLARGIDILQVNLVINFDIPLDRFNKPDVENYLHRIGRTGRFGRSGVSINFVHDKKSLENMMAIQRYFGKEIVRIPTESLAILEEKLQQINNS